MLKNYYHNKIKILKIFKLNQYLLKKLGLNLILVFAFISIFSSIYISVNSSLWMDEIFEIYNSITGNSLDKRMDQASFIYNYLVVFVVKNFGSNVLNFRFINFFILLIFLTIIFINFKKSKFFIILAFAISQKLNIFYLSEIRPYFILNFLCIFLFFIYFKLLYVQKLNFKNYIYLFVLSFIISGLHYYGYLFVFVILLILTINFKKNLYEKFKLISIFIFSSIIPLTLNYQKIILIFNYEINRKSKLINQIGEDKNFLSELYFLFDYIFFSKKIFGLILILFLLFFIFKKIKFNKRDLYVLYPLILFIFISFIISTLIFDKIEWRYLIPINSCVLFFLYKKLNRSNLTILLIFILFSGYGYMIKNKYFLMKKAPYKDIATFVKKNNSLNVYLDNEFFDEEVHILRLYFELENIKYLKFSDEIKDKEIIFISKINNLNKHKCIKHNYFDYKLSFCKNLNK